MSQVRMCDVCGKLFPTTDQGSMTGQITKTIRNSYGALESINEPMDICGECGKPKRLSAEIEGSAT